MKKFIVSILLLLSIILFSNNAVTFAKEKRVNHKNCGIDRLNPRLNIS